MSGILKYNTFGFLLAKDGHLCTTCCGVPGCPEYFNITVSGLTGGFSSWNDTHIVWNFNFFQLEWACVTGAEPEIEFPCATSIYDPNGVPAGISLIYDQDTAIWTVAIGQVDTVPFYTVSWQFSGGTLCHPEGAYTYVDQQPVEPTEPSQSGSACSVSIPP